ncbi:hypothetical protein [Helicobacter canadensis]|uniref:Uncharacterized protein n=1 Tax=Helicobacter canadensis MIT 98-5491 TaxID=537970 RepID=C5ZXH8_9HELI|nr:hypothetical protein [Helicobacter canadensis]EES89846.1 conserved hypothetical protein [Helicobacter canadensis MIT 98-5491]STO99888.1 Uncharacterised protein [Helicobacter canadensis]
MNNMSIKENYASYASSIAFLKEIQKNWTPQNDKNETFEAALNQAESLEKQEEFQTIITQFQENENPLPIDTQTSKDNLEYLQESEASEFLVSDEKKPKNSLFDFENKASKFLTLQDEISNQETTLPKNQEKEELILNNQRNSFMGDFFEKTLVQTSPKAPQNISEEIKNAYNPLEVDAEQGVGENMISFIDEVSGKKVAIPLNEANAKKLNEKFGSLEAASDYVKGWYYDAAYGMGYLKGDVDGDGKISLEEGIHLNSLVSLKDGQYHSISEQIPGSTDEQMKFLEQVGFIDNLGDYINHSISQDSNLDGALNLNEIMGDKNEIMLFQTNGDSQSLDIFVIQKFNLEVENIEESLNNILLNLGVKEEETKEPKQEEREEEKDEVKETQAKIATNDEEIQEWLEVARNLQDENYLNSLDLFERENWLKSDTILQNLLLNV